MLITRECVTRFLDFGFEMDLKKENVYIFQKQYLDKKCIFYNNIIHASLILLLEIFMAYAFIIRKRITMYIDLA